MQFESQGKYAKNTQRVHIKQFKKYTYMKIYVSNKGLHDYVLTCFE